jgi:hypothetical protein
MIRPTKTQVVVASGISLDDFASDVPHAPRSAGANAASNAGIIDGVTATALIANADDRGSLSELLTTRDGPIARNANALPAFAVERNDRLNGELMVRAHIGERAGFIVAAVFCPCGATTTDACAFKSPA